MWSEEQPGHRRAESTRARHTNEAETSCFFKDTLVAATEEGSAQLYVASVQFALDLAWLHACEELAAESPEGGLDIPDRVLRLRALCPHEVRPLQTGAAKLNCRTQARFRRPAKSTPGGFSPRRNWPGDSARLGDFHPGETGLAILASRSVAKIGVKIGGQNWQVGPAILASSFSPRFGVA